MEPTKDAMAGPETVMAGLAVVLMRPKLPENVGAVARACANMGCARLVIVDPCSWDPGRASALATSKGRPLIEQATFEPDLTSALAPFSLVFGTTARTGGWRKKIASPEEIAPQIVGSLSAGSRIGLVFGPEDTGLTNQEIELCGNLVTIPTAQSAASLNLAQAVLVILYECFKCASRAFPAPIAKGDEPVGWDERERLFDIIRETLLLIDFLKVDNAEFWMLSVKRFMNRFEIRRSEYDMLMGICRQVRWAAASGGRRL
jgi:tRNA/rRNA methyltransferase